MKQILGDNVFWATLGTVLIPALAIIFIGLNVLIRDGSNVPGELQYLEIIGGGGTVVSGVYGAIHALLAKKPNAPLPPPPPAA